MNNYTAHGSRFVSEHAAREYRTSVALEEAMADLQVLGVRWLIRAYHRHMTIHIREQVG